MPEIHGTLTQASLGDGEQTIQNGILILAFVWLLWQPKEKSLNLYISLTNGQILILFGQKDYLVTLHMYAKNEFYIRKNMAARGWS